MWILAPGVKAGPPNRCSSANADSGARLRPQDRLYPSSGDECKPDEHDKHDTGGCRGWVQHAGRSPSSAAGIAVYRPKTVHGIRFRFAAATARRAAAIAGLGAGPAPGTIYGIGKRRSIGLARDCPPNKPKCRGAS